MATPHAYEVIVSYSPHPSVIGTTMVQWDVGDMNFNLQLRYSTSFFIIPSITNRQYAALHAPIYPLISLLCRLRE